MPEFHPSRSNLLYSRKFCTVSSFFRYQEESAILVNRITTNIKFVVLWPKRAQSLFSSLECYLVRGKIRKMTKEYTRKIFLKPQLYETFNLVKAVKYVLKKVVFMPPPRAVTASCHRRTRSWKESRVRGVPAVFTVCARGQRNPCLPFPAGSVSAEQCSAPSMDWEEPRREESW